MPTDTAPSTTMTKRTIRVPDNTLRRFDGARGILGVEASEFYTFALGVVAAQVLEGSDDNVRDIRTAVQLFAKQQSE